MEEKNKRTAFLLRINYKAEFDDLSDSQAGILIKAIFEYIAASSVSDRLKDKELKMAFRFIKKDLDNDHAKKKATRELIKKGV